MFKKLLLPLAVLAIFAYFLKDIVFSDNQYALRLRQARQEKNPSFRLAANSPLTSAQREAFDSLRYFAPDPGYRVEARLERFSQPETVEMPLTRGPADKYLRWGKATFELQNQPQQLVLFLKADGQDSTLFVPFTDKTNGFDTYGGGRYLDVPLPANGAGEIELDFNQAYSPYCAYNNEYACPVPPADNRLTVAVPAGEKSFHDHAAHAGEEHGAE